MSRVETSEQQHLPIQQHYSLPLTLLVAFYFSDSNLPNDRFLFSLTCCNTPMYGWVPIRTLLSFSRMSQRGLKPDTDVPLAAFAIRRRIAQDGDKPLLAISEDGQNVRRKAIVEKDGKDAWGRTVYVVSHIPLPETSRISTDKTALTPRRRALASEAQKNPTPKPRLRTICVNLARSRRSVCVARMSTRANKAAKVVVPSRWVNDDVDYWLCICNGKLTRRAPFSVNLPLSRTSKSSSPSRRCPSFQNRDQRWKNRPSE